jgi:hypothetical protein
MNKHKRRKMTNRMSTIRVNRIKEVNIEEREEAGRGKRININNLIPHIQFFLTSSENFHKLFLEKERYQENAQSG